MMRFLYYKWQSLVHRIYINIGELSESALKHRSSILMISVIMLVIEPHATLTLGKASLAGLGISVEPPQSVPVGLFLYVLLMYRLIAFWAAVLLDSGTDDKVAREKAIHECDPGYYDDEENPHDMRELIRRKSSEIVYKWKLRKMLWEIFIPNILGATSLIYYSYIYIKQW